LRALTALHPLHSFNPRGFTALDLLNLWAFNRLGTFDRLRAFDTLNGRAFNSVMLLCLLDTWVCPLHALCRLGALHIGALDAVAALIVKTIFPVAVFALFSLLSALYLTNITTLALGTIALFATLDIAQIAPVAVVHPLAQLFCARLGALHGSIAVHVGPVSRDLPGLTAL
jgi:hypothetical protein